MVNSPDFFSDLPRYNEIKTLQRQISVLVFWYTSPLHYNHRYYSTCRQLLSLNSFFNKSWPRTYRYSTTCRQLLSLNSFSSSAGQEHISAIRHAYNCYRLIFFNKNRPRTYQCMMCICICLN